jgi:hypothetical protein
VSSSLHQLRQRGGQQLCIAWCRGRCKRCGARYAAQRSQPHPTLRLRAGKPRARRSMGGWSMHANVNAWPGFCGRRRPHMAVLRFPAHLISAFYGPCSLLAAGLWGSCKPSRLWLSSPVHSAACPPVRHYNVLDTSACTRTAMDKALLFWAKPAKLEQPAKCAVRAFPPRAALSAAPHNLPKGLQGGNACTH